MDLTLSEEQLMFKKMFADFCTKEIRPKGEHIDQAEEPPEDLLAKAVDQGFWAALVPEELEGCGMDVYTFTLMLEELGRADMSTALILSVHNCLVVKPLLEYGSDEQKEQYLEALAFGEKLGAFALTEASAGSDATALKMTATRNGAGYVLNGAKNWVSNGSLAGLFLVFAKAEGGITAFLVEPETAGVKVGYREKTLGLRGVPANTIYFDGVHVPEANRLGAEGKGMEIALQALSLSRLGLAAHRPGRHRASSGRGSPVLHRAHPVRRPDRPEADHPELCRRRQDPDRGAALPGDSTPLGWPTRGRTLARRHPSPSCSALASPTR